MTAVTYSRQTNTVTLPTSSVSNSTSAGSSASCRLGGGNYQVDQKGTDNKPFWKSLRDSLKNRFSGGETSDTLKPGDQTSDIRRLNNESMDTPVKTRPNNSRPASTDVRESRLSRKKQKIIDELTTPVNGNYENIRQAHVRGSGTPRESGAQRSVKKPSDAETFRPYHLY